MAQEKKHKVEDGVIPRTLINQLVEHTAGGFVLFYYNAKDGTPEEIMTFDSPAHCLGLQKHISDWSLALQDLTIETERNLIQRALKHEPEPDDGDVPI